MKVWVDPPRGWQYGFPKVWTPETDQDVTVWLVKEGYPQAEIDSLGKSFSFRSWEATDQPTDFRRGISTKKG